MIDFEYAGRQLRGVFLLVFTNKDWRADIDCSVNGVFLSFSAILLSAPFALLGFHAAHKAAAAAPEFPQSPYGQTPLAILMSAELIALASFWAASIFTLVISARLLQASRSAGGLIVAYNWGQLLIFLLSAAPAALLAFTYNVSLFALLALPVVVASLFITWRILRVFLSTDVAITIFMMILLTIVELSVNSIVMHAIISLHGLFS